MNKKFAMPTGSEIVPVVILADGDYPRSGTALSVLDNARRVVCCDGASVEYVKCGGIPYAIVGDCDSLPENMHDRFADLIYRDSDQETNDLTKAVNFCVSNGMDDIVIVGATGKREDHTIGNVGLLIEYAQIARVRMLTDYGIFEAMSGEVEFESFPGQQVSVFTPLKSVTVSTIGLRYPLHEALLGGWWQGTLNESLGGSFGLNLSDTAIIFRVFAAEQH